MARERWNAEVLSAVRWAQSKDWARVRESMEDSVARLLGTGLEKGREGVVRGEEGVRDVVHHVVDKSRR